MKKFILILFFLCSTQVSANDFKKCKKTLYQQTQDFAFASSVNINFQFFGNIEDIFSNQAQRHQLGLCMSISKGFLKQRVDYFIVGSAENIVQFYNRIQYLLAEE